MVRTQRLDRACRAPQPRRWLSDVGGLCHGADMTTRIDCDTCVVRGLACHDCVVTVLLGPPPELTLDDEEREALAVLAQGGLVPPLRLVEPVPGPVVESA